MTFKPMKGDDADLSRLVFPYMLSPKLDGHRCLIKDGVALTSSLKPFPNKFIQAFFASGEYDGLDGELIVGEPTSPNVFRDTSSGVRRVEGEPDFTFWAFDRWDLGDRSARERHATLYDIVLPIDERVVPLAYYNVVDHESLDWHEAELVGEGYEGVMLRHPHSPYKCGRSTVKENYLLKVKRFADAEAEIIGFVEQMKNTNEKTTNALGRGERSSAKAGKVGKGTLGALQVRGINGKYKGVEFEIGTGLDDRLRHEIWNYMDCILGRVCTYKFQDVGNYDKPRIPVFKAFRDRKEVE